MCCVPLRHEMKSREGDRKFISNHYMAHIIQSAKHRDSLPRKLASFLAVSISYPGDWLQTASRTRPPLFHTGTWPRLRCWPGSGEPSQLQNNMCHQHHSPHEKCTLCVCVCVCVCLRPTVVDILSEVADRFGVSQIQLPGDYLGPPHLPHDVTGSLLSLRHVSARQNHPRTYGNSTPLSGDCVWVHVSKSEHRLGCCRAQTFRQFHIWATSLDLLFLQLSMFPTQALWAPKPVWIFNKKQKKKHKESVRHHWTLFSSFCLPLPARSLAVSLPIPTLAPVTTAVFPSRRTSEDHLGINRDLKSEVWRGYCQQSRWILESSFHCQQEREREREREKKRGKKRTSREK